MEQTTQMIPRIDSPAYSKLFEMYYCELVHFLPNDCVYRSCRLFKTFSEAQYFYDQMLQKGYWTSV